MELLMKLPEVYREVLLLYYVMGYNVRETARLLRLTESAVKKRLERGRKKLKETMEGGRFGCKAQAHQRRIVRRLRGFPACCVRVRDPWDAECSPMGDYRICPGGKVGAPGTGRTGAAA